jgi:hypothetical protein
LFYQTANLLPQQQHCFYRHTKFVASAITTLFYQHNKFVASATALFYQHNKFVASATTAIKITVETYL